MVVNNNKNIPNNVTIVNVCVYIYIYTHTYHDTHGVTHVLSFLKEAWHNLKNENYELQGTGWATRAPVAQTLQSVRQTCACTTATCLYWFARFSSCGIFTPTRTMLFKMLLFANTKTAKVTLQPAGKLLANL